MKILFIAPCYYPTIGGGAEKSLKLLAEGLVRNGLEVSVLSFDGLEKKNMEERNGVKVIRIKKLNWKPNTFALNITLLLHKDIVKKERPDIIHVYNTWHTPSSYFLRKYAPVVSTLNNYFPICASGITKDNLLERGKFDVISMFRGTFITFKGNKLIRLFAAVAYTFYNKITLPFSKRIDAYVVYNNALGDIYRSAGFDKKKFFIISNLFEEKKALKIDIKREENILLYVGGLSEAKGVLELIEAFRLIDDKKIQLGVIGDGELKSKMEHIAKKHELNVKFYGRVNNQDELSEYYRKSTLLVHPSIYPETLSRVWVEALQNEIPIIASDTLTAKDVLRESAIYYKRGHPEELADKIKKILAGEIKTDPNGANKSILSQQPLKEMILMYEKLRENEA
jgi:glycosyltransferase involved in cell wall biosynthesis